MSEMGKALLLMLWTGEPLEPYIELMRKEKARGVTEVPFFFQETKDGGPFQLQEQEGRRKTDITNIIKFLECYETMSKIKIVRADDYDKGVMLLTLHNIKTGEDTIINI